MVPPSSQGVPSYEAHETSYRLPGIHGAIAQWMSLGASPWSRVAHYMLLLGLTQRLGDIKPLLGSSLLPLRSRGRGQRRAAIAARRDRTYRQLASAASAFSSQDP